MKIDDCELGYNGDCCCNCKFRLKIVECLDTNGKHSCNNFILYACVAFFVTKNTKKALKINNNGHSMCEMHNRM